MLQCCTIQQQLEDEHSLDDCIHTASYCVEVKTEEEIMAQGSGV